MSAIARARSSGRFAPASRKRTPSSQTRKPIASRSPAIAAPGRGICAPSPWYTGRMHMTVGVLRGGPSREHEVSLKSGAAILAHLPEDKYEARDIYINKQGIWHDRGRPTTPERILRQLDVALL